MNGLRSVLPALLLASACATVPASPPRPDSALVATAASALDGDGDELIHSAAKIDLAARGLRRIREEHPVVRDIHAGSGGLLEVRLRDEAWTRSIGSQHSILTGLPGVDSVSRRVRASRVRRQSDFERALLVFLPPEVNTPVAARLYAALPEVETAEPPILIGMDGGHLRIRTQPDSVVYHLSRGWGDCPSGCIWRRAWTFSYHPRTDRVRLLRDTGDPTPAAGYAAWRRRADWSVFDTLPEDKRRAFAAQMAAEPRPPRRLLEALIPRLTMMDWEVSARLLERPEVAASPSMVAGLARLQGDAGRQARTVLLDRHGLRIAADHGSSPELLRPLLEEFIGRDPPPRDLSVALVRNRTVLADPSLLGILIRELNHHPELHREACAAYLESGYPVWERVSQDTWASSVACPDLPPHP